MENEIKSKITVNTKEAEESLNELKAKVKELKDTVANTSPDSPLFTGLVSNLGAAKEKLTTLKDTIKELESDAISLKTFVDVSGNIKSGFTAAKSAAELFGVETKGIEKIINRVSKAQKTFSSIQKIYNKVQSKAIGLLAKGASAKDNLAGSIGGATKSFKLFNKAMSASVIGAIITAVATLAAYWQDIREALRFTSSEQKDQLKASEESVSAEEDKLAALERQDNIKREQGVSEKEILRSKLRQTDEIIKAARINLENQKATLKSQIEAEKRNKRILKGILEFVTGGFLPILHGIDKIGSFFGKDFKLAEGFKEIVASQFFDPEEVKKKGDEAIKASEEKIAALENQASGHALAIKKIDKKAYEDWVRKFKRDTENELKLRKEKNTLTEEYELKVLEEFRKHKIVSEVEYRLKKQKIGDRYDKLDKERIEKAATDVLKVEKNGLAEVLDAQNKIYDEKLYAEKLKLAQGKITQEEFAKESLHIETKRLQKLKEAQDQYHGQSIEDIKQHFTDEKAELDRKRADRLITEDDYYKQLATLDAASKETNRGLLATQAIEDAALNASINENKLANETASTEDRNRIAAAEVAFKKKLQEDTLNLASALGDLLQKEGKKQNTIQKGVALVKIGIDSAKAISSALANANSPTPDNVATGGIAGIAKFIAISAQILTAAAAAKRILSSGQGSAGASTPTTPSTPTISAPQISAPRLSGTPIVARQHNPEPIKVFVSEADIRNTQRKVQVIEEQSEVV